MAEPAPEVPDIRPDVAAGLQMLEALNRRRLYFIERQASTIDQMSHRVAAAYRAGEIDAEELRVIYRAMRDNSPGGWSKAWQQQGLPNIRILNAEAQRRRLDAPTEPDGSWQGENPIGHAPRPGRGQAVVYVLYDERLQPVYVGSTEHFVSRLSAHRHSGKVFAYWRAFPCLDREDAYWREEQMLRGSLPRLNKKVTR